jgi:hypothetical protein
LAGFLVGEGRRVEKMADGGHDFILHYITETNNELIF